MNQTKKSFLERPGVQAVGAALICVVLGLLIGLIRQERVRPS